MSEFAGQLALARYFDPASGAATETEVLVLEQADRQCLVMRLPLPLVDLLASLSSGNAPAVAEIFHLDSSQLHGLHAATPSELEQVHRWAARYWVARHGASKFDQTPPFVPGQTTVPPSGKVIGTPELLAMTDAVMDGWLTTGRFNTRFEQALGQFVGVPHVLTTSSGSSANLLAFMALTSPRLGERAIRPGDEVITVAAGFPTTVNPAIQFGAIPVFVDIQLPTYNIDVSRIEAAISPKTRAIMLAHTLGNPFDVAAVKALADKHGLWLVEDCCDALGARFNGQHVGTFGDLATVSFYPAHHITMGEGGAVFGRSAELMAIVESFRDWGRDCYCKTGCDNTCGKRFGWQFGELPFGYDHKYVYTHVGYNLKITDMQAACALAQMDRLPGFITTRQQHFDYLSQALQPLADRLLLPQATPGSEPSWFGFPLTLRPEAGVARVDLLAYLDSQKIGSRLLFGGNLLRQPYMKGVPHRVSGGLEQTDTVMHDTFWIGLYPGLTTAALDWTVQQLRSYLGVFD